MLKIRLLDSDILPRAGVLRAAQVRALTDAAEIMATAEAAATAREADQTRRLDEARATATEEAYAEGLRDLAAAAAAYREATEALQGRLEELLRECLARVFRARPADEVLRATVTPVLAGLVSAREVAIAVHPDRAAALETALADATSSGGALAGAPIAIEGDPELGLEDCRIFTASEVVNIGVPVVIERLIGALAAHLSEPHGDAAREAEHG